MADTKTSALTQGTTPPQYVYGVDDSLVGKKYRGLRIKNVLDYNAKGDGSTDDQAAIKAAVDDTSPPFSTEDRGVIYFPNTSSYYKVNSSIPFELADGILSIGFVGAPGARIVGDFNDAILKRSADSPASNIMFIEGLKIENANNGTSAAGILFHSVVGGSIRNVRVSAFHGIETYNSQSITIQDSIVIAGSLTGATIGIFAGNCTSVLSTDVSGYAVGLQHMNLGLIVHGGRFEVNTVGMLLGMDPDGDPFQTIGADIAGVSMESNSTGIYLYDVSGSSIRATSPTAAQANIDYGYRLRSVQDTTISDAAYNSVTGWSVAGFSLGEGPLARVTISNIKSVDGASSSWQILAPGLESFVIANCNIELTVAQLPIGAVVGTVMPVKDATATTVGTTVAGGGSNHVAVVWSAGVWRII